MLKACGLFVSLLRHKCQRTRERSECEFIIKINTQPDSSTKKMLFRLELRHSIKSKNKSQEEMQTLFKAKLKQ